MFNCKMRQVEERHVAYKVDRMVWSDRLDLLAISNLKGDVQVHRLHWQKVWSLPPPNEGDLVQAMAWRPDGKVLAIAYSSGWVLIIDVEDKDVLDKFHLEHTTQPNRSSSQITCMRWSMKAEDKKCKPVENVYDDASIFLPKASLNNEFKTEGGSSTEENTKNFKEVQEQTQLNILLIGYGFGNVHMRIFGKFPLGTFNIGVLVKDDLGDFIVLDMNLTEDFSAMQLIYLDKLSNCVLATVLNTCLLSAYAQDILSVANKHCQIVHMMSYMDQTMASISEAWETVLLEMDKKMSRYAASVPEGGMSADFLELLMMGVPSDDLEVFLLRDLTAEGLKKFGNYVELSYSTIQKLVLRQVNIVGQSLMYYLCELRGITRIPDRFKILGIEESVVTDSIRAGFAFLNKCLELQQVIDSSMKNYKLFFRWLYVVIVRLLDEETPSEIVKITQQDTAQIAEFLYNFDNSFEQGDSGEKRAVFRLDRLGQYLQNEELKLLPDDDDNPWHKFLFENPCFLKDNETIFHPTEFRKYSLVQQQEHFKKAISKVFDITTKDFGSHFSVAYNFKCYVELSNESSLNTLKVSQTYDAIEQRFMFAIFSQQNIKDGLFFMCVNNKKNDNTVSCIKYYFSQKLLGNSEEESSIEEVPIIDIQFYSREYLSVLIADPQASDSSIFIQLPVKIAIDNANELESQTSFETVQCVPIDNVSRRDISPLLDQGFYKVLDQMDGLKIAVSGGLKVAVVLSKSNRKVRVFEMEADVEDDTEDDITPQSLRSDASIPSTSKSALNITEVSEDIAGDN